jgi:hypothetical protein
MKRLAILGALLAGTLVLWEHREAVHRYIDREIPSASRPRAIDYGQKSTRRTKTRVNQTRAIDSGGAEALRDGMSRNEVTQLLGDPSSIENDGRGEVWIYDVVGKKIVFRNGLVFSIDPI